MRKISRLVAAGAIIAPLLGAQALAGTFVEVTPPEGAVFAGVIGINDQGDVAGSFSTDGETEMGFVGSIDGNYETFSMGGPLTQPRSLNNQGRSVGLYVGDGALKQFERAADGTLTAITKDSVEIFGIAQGIAPSGKFVGDYVREPGSVPQRGGYQGQNAVYEADVDLPFPAIRVAPRATNAKGDIAGWFIAEPGGAPQGFVMKGGETTVLNFPGAVSTFIQGMNNKGEISGGWDDADGNSHGFYLASDLESWTSFDAPTGDRTGGWQINSLGQIAVSASSDDAFALYIYCPKKAGVCKDANGKAGKEKKAKGKANMKTPEPGKKGPDPEAGPKKKNQHHK